MLLSKQSSRPNDEHEPRSGDEINSKWVVRTIRDGAVVISGDVFRVEQQHMAYDGRLDGKRYLFARYNTSEGWEPFVFLWGSEAYWKATRGMTGEEPEFPDSSAEPECIDGTLPWCWWRL